MLNGFMANYKWWTHQGEANRVRDQIMRQRIDACDANAGVGDMLNDYNETHFDEGPREEEKEEEVLEPIVKVYYQMIEAAQQPFHGHTKFSQLDAIACLMAVKFQFSLSRGAFDVMSTIIESLLLETIYQRTCMRLRNCLVHLRCHMNRCLSEWMCLI